MSTGITTTTAHRSYKTPTTAEVSAAAAIAAQVKMQNSGCVSNTPTTTTTASNKRILASRVPIDVLDKIAFVLGIETTPSQHEEFWSASSQPPYVVVNANTTHPAFHTNRYTNGTRVFSDAGWDALRSATSVVMLYDEQTHDEKQPAIPKVVRRGLPYAWVVGTESLLSAQGEAIAPRYTNYGIPVPSFETICEQRINVTISPLIEGTTVYIWKEGGVARFSTQLKADASQTRFGSSRLLSEIWGSLGGDNIESFFPDPEEPDGEYISYVFLIVHPQLMTTSKVNCGNGYLMLIGIVDSKTGTMVGLKDNRVKWEGSEDLVDPSYSPNLNDPLPSCTYEMVSNTSSVPVVSPNPEDPEGTMIASGECIAEVGGDPCDVMQYDAMREDLAMRSGIYAPFPPPSTTCRPFPDKGSAAASAYASLHREDGNEDGLSPPMYISPSITVGEAQDILSFGFFGGNRAFFDPTSPYVVSNGPTLPPVTQSAESKNAVGTGGGSESGGAASFSATAFDSRYRGGGAFSMLFSTGDRIIIRCRHPETGRDEAYIYTPAAYSWRMAVLGNNSNVSHRLSEIQSLSTITNFQEAQQTTPAWFDMRVFTSARALSLLTIASQNSRSKGYVKTPHQHSTASTHQQQQQLPPVSSPKYENIFPPIPKYMNAILFDEGMNVFRKLRDQLSAGDSNLLPCVSSVPFEVESALVEIDNRYHAQDEDRYTAMVNKRGDHIRFAWATLLFTIASSPIYQKLVMEAFLKVYENNQSVVNVVSECVRTARRLNCEDCRVVIASSVSSAPASLKSLLYDSAGFPKFANRSLSDAANRVLSGRMIKAEDSVNQMSGEAIYSISKFASDLVNLVSEL